MIEHPCTVTNTPFTRYSRLSNWLTGLTTAVSCKRGLGKTVKKRTPSLVDFVTEVGNKPGEQKLHEGETEQIRVYIG